MYQRGQIVDSDLFLIHSDTNKPREGLAENY